GRNGDVGPGGAAGVVDHIGDPAVPTETDRNYAVEPDISIVRHLNRPRQEDVGVTKHTVDAQTPGFVAGNCAGDLIRGPAVGLGRAGPTDLIGRIVGQFRLVEVDSPAIAVPDHLVLLVVL